ncbi:MAG: hypothetical protein RL033_5277 [Pseudomonadota bacterium]|jgi:hypothetical protein
MWPLRAVSRHLLALWLLLPWLLLGCANVIGIEERRADVADNYPEQGYAGCRPGNCGGCLDVHRRECEARSACAQAVEEDDCAGCVCQSCSEQLVDCQLDSGCSAIWLCLRETRCDLSERAAGNCQDACGTVIQANGGVGGSAWRAAVAVRSCAASAACLTCLAPQVQQSERSCSQQNGCQDCDDCFAQCLCSGERFGVCRELCGDQAPADCSEANGCANCGNCFDACACSGDSFQQCSQACGSPTATEPGCTAAMSCTGCADCAAQCLCSGGGDATECSVLCGEPAPENACEFDSGGGTALCEGCTSCLAGCTCNGTELSACMDTCGHHDCCDSRTCATGSVTACSCESSAETCFEAVYGSCEGFFDCDACACRQCPGELGVCLDQPGCKSIFDCMRNTECHGTACSERCGTGTTPEDFAVAEALWACYHGAQCTCSGEPPIVSCPGTQGNVDCAGYQSSSATLLACCPEQPAASGEQVETVGIPDSDPCGLELSRYFRSARACEPRNQANPSRFAVLETCPELPVGGVVYNGATLRGCCRAADGMCGYYDDVTGLGCLDAGIFGMAPEPCP